MRGFAAIGLYMPKNDLNVGGALRAAHVFQASMAVIQGRRYWPMSSDTTKAPRNFPVLHGVDDLFDHVPYSCVPVAVELIEGARNLVDFHHPERAFYIFGPEEGSVPSHVLDRCPHKVMVPTTFCMNLAATVNVVLYDRMAKQMQRQDHLALAA